MRLKVIINPAAARGRTVKLLPAIRRWLPGGVHTYDFVIPASRDKLLDEAAHAREQGYEGVLACGGDGTVHDVLIGLNGTGLPMGVLPAGRGNDTSRNYTLPQGLEAACKGMRHTRIEWFDLPLADGIPFMSSAFAGFDGLVAKLTHEGRCPFGGAVCYTWNILVALLRYRPLELRIVLDGKVHEGRYMMVTLANGPYYGGGMKIAPAANPKDGLFDIILVDPVSIPLLLSIFPKIFSGKHTLHPKVSVHRAQRVEITMLSQRRDLLFADGEPFTQLPTTLEIQPKALPLIVPR